MISMGGVNMHRFLSTVAILSVVLAWRCVATGQDTADPDEVVAAVSLPKSLNQFRQIYFYQSQAAELLPPSYRPIDIAELEQRLQAAPAGSLRSPNDTPQLIRSVYVARFEQDSLVSTRSYWDILGRDQEPARLVLGKLGLALRVEADVAAAEPDRHSGQIVSDLDGEASVLVAGDSRLGFAWSAAGRSIERGIMFDLRIPLSIQTRFLIEVPQGIQVQAIDGVGRSLPSPPPEAGMPASLAKSSATSTAWYSIDAGGLSRVRLRLLNRFEGEPEAILPIRQGSIQYDLMPQSIRFTSRLLVDSRPGSPLPILALDDGQVTAVRIGGSAVPWSEVTTGQGIGIRIDTTRLDSNSGSGTLNITIEGNATWNHTAGTQSLPWPSWQGCRPILLATEMQAQVRLDSSLVALRLKLPTHWRFTPTVTAEDGSKLFRCVGPLASQGIAVLVKPDEQQSTADSVLRMSVANNRIQAQLDSSVVLSDLGPQPIQLKMDRNWTAELVTLPRSGRVIDLPNDPEARHTITIWPTSDELVGRRLQIRVTGSALLKSVADRIEFPATSFAVVQNCRSRVVALVTPPIGYNWTGDVALRTTRVTTSQLSAVQREMMGESAEDSLLIELNEGRVATLVCRRPDIAFDAVSRLALRLDADRLVETYLIACTSVSTEIQSILVDLGESAGRPPMQWSALRVDGSSRRIAAASRVGPEDLVPRDTTLTDQVQVQVSKVGTADALASEVWRLELGDTGERAVMLVGRREYKLTGVKEIPLPSVPGASNQNNQVVVMPSLSVTRMSSSVLKVPRLLNARTQLKQYGAIPAENDPVAGAMVLRHDATEKATIEITKAATTEQVPVIWRETVRVTASNRGGDTVMASYDLDHNSTLIIDHDVNLRLVSVTDQDGQPINYDAVPDQLTIKTSASVSRIVTHWTRNVFSSSIARKWMAPQLKAVGIILNQDWKTTPAPDTLIPASVFVGEAIPLDASGGRVWIVDSGVGYAVASMIGLCMFAAGWWTAARSPFVTALVWVCSVVPPMYLFTTYLLWVASVCVPIAAGALTALTLSANIKRRTTNSSLQIKTQPNAPRTSLPSEHSHTGMISWTGRLPIWLMMLSAMSAAAVLESQSIAQTPALSNANPVDPILVPTTASGEIAGTKVYVPQGLYTELFREQLPVLSSLRVKSANYRLRLTGSTESETTAELEARYQLDDLPQRIEARLPFRASQLRSVQWLTDADARPLRWSPDGENSIRVTLPVANSASLLIRVNCELQAPSRTTRRAQFPIPPIANATLVVDAGFAVQRLDLVGSIGEIDTQPELGRLNAAIGGISDVDLTITYREAARSIAAIAQRRYWIHAGYERTNIECEVELSDTSIRKGGEVPLVLLDAETPILLTHDWTMLATEVLSPIRRQLTLQALRDNPGPIRFLWEQDSLIASTLAAEDPVPVVIPDVVSAGSVATPPAVIALDAAQGLRLIPKLLQQPLAILTAPNSTATSASNLPDAPLSNQGVPASTAAATSPANAPTPQPLASTTSPEIVDAFIASWKGFRGTASEIVTSASPLTRFIIAAPAPRPWQADEVHHLHVRPNELQLSYAATITTGDRMIGPLRIILPLDSDLRVLTMNDVSVNSIPHRVGNRNEVSLPELMGTDIIRLRVVIHMRIPQRFSPPLISTEPVSLVKGTYTLSRDQSLLVEEVVDGGLAEAENPVMGTDQQLTGGWVPCWTWRLDQRPRPDAVNPTSKPQLPGRFRVLARDVAITTQQRTSLIWDQTRWSIETILRLKGADRERQGNASIHEPIDFVNVELPTIWCDHLTVEPAEAWSRQPSIDPATQIVRIRPLPATEPDGVITIRLRGQRSVDSDARLEVPAVRVLGGGKRDVFLTVPKHIDGRPIDWEANAAISARLPEELLRVPPTAATPTAVSSSVTTAGRTDELVFRTVAGNASVRLAPSRLEVTDPKITVADVQLFAVGGKQTAMICRWDICPGREEEITIDLPAYAQPIEVLIDNEPTAWTRRDSQLDVRLTLSRLAQNIVLICRLDAPNHSLGVPQIRNITVDQTWLTLFEADDDEVVAQATINAPDGWHVATAQDRILALADSIRVVTEASLSRATDRSQEEIVRWITPWDQRFRALAEQPTTLLLESDVPQPETSTRWNEQQRKWQQYLRRVAGETAFNNSLEPFSLVPPNHWRIAAVATHQGNAQRLPTVRLGSGGKGLAIIIQATLMILLTAGLVLLMWRWRRWLKPLTAHAAVWMFATGVASLAVAPVPVAVAICVVAITAPWLNPVPPPLPRRN